MSFVAACPNARETLLEAVSATMTKRVQQRVSRLLFALASVAIFFPLIGLTSAAIWLAAFLLTQGCEIVAFPRGQVRDQRAARVAFALFLINKLVFGLIAIPLAVIGGPLGVAIGMVVLAGALIHAVAASGSSRLMAGAAAGPPLSVLASLIGILLVSGSDHRTTFVLASSALLLCLAAFGAWRRVSEDMCTLNAAREASELASQAKSDFLTMISHEIRTPLNGMMGMAQSLVGDPLTPVQAERLETLITSGRGLRDLIAEVIDLGGIEAGLLEIEAVTFSLRDLVQRSIEPFEAIAKARNLEICVSLCPGLASAYLGDPVRIRQVLHNMIANGVQLTDTGGILVSASRDVDGVRLSVCDSGPGVPDHLLAGIFDKYARLDPAIPRADGSMGLGLGLFMANQLVQRMGGSITATNRIPTGLCLTAALPLPIAEPIAPRSPGPSQPRPATGALRVLAAEDHPVNRKVLALLLEQIDVVPTLVENGMQAVEACREGDWDIVLMDIQMPVLGGVDAARMIVEEARTAGRTAPPIVAVTANVMQHQLKIYSESGMEHCVPKPIEATTLFDVMQTSLNRSGLTGYTAA